MEGYIRQQAKDYMGLAASMCELQKFSLLHSADGFESRFEMVSTSLAQYCSHLDYAFRQQISLKTKLLYYEAQISFKLIQANY